MNRKLAELGYNRSAKKCKEKFENVQKYYKRTKEGRGGRQDGKTYKFFTQLEALHNAAAATTTTQNLAASSTSTFSINPTPVSVGFGISNPTPISSVKIHTPTTTISSQTPMGIFSPPPVPAAPMGGVSFSSNTSSASTEDDEIEEEDIMGFDVDLEGEPSSVAGTSRKRRRAATAAEKGSGGGSRTTTTSHKMMMEFFEGLMKQIMHKQEIMQQKFLEAIEKREQDRMIREETWKRQEMARLSREQEKMAQERTISASRDAAIIGFLQKFTGQNIQLPVVNISPAAAVPTPQQQQQHDVPVPVPVPAPVPMPVPLSPVPSTPLQPQTTLPQHQTQKTTPQIPQIVQNQPPSNAMPFQEISQGGDQGASSEPISSRWPKPEVLALIKIRGGLESRYQETGPKGPLWEEISAGMQQIGYKRSAKRCKEKWENINKYFKKVKESNKRRREDSKTCPYFNELDALYRKKISTTTGEQSADPIKEIMGAAAPSTSMPEGLSVTLFGEEQPATTSTKVNSLIH